VIRWALLLVAGLAVASCAGLHDEPDISRSDAEDRIREVVDATLAELDLDGASEVIDGPEHCGAPTEEEKSIYSVFVTGLDEGRPRSAVEDARSFWDGSASEWSSDGEFELTGDVSAATLNFDGLEVFVSVTGGPDGLMVKGSTGCYD
jgi:hypothetical protein